MKTIIRNFLSILRRYRLATLLNVLGLSVAFAAFLAIMIQVDYDRNFDACHRDADRIFRVESAGVFGEEDFMTLMSRPWADAIIRSSAHVVAGTIIKNWGDNLFFSVETNGERHFYEERLTPATPSFTDVFAFDMTEGSDRALAEPEKILIPQSMSRKLFGAEEAVGRTLTGKEASYTVGGVYRDFPRNSSVRNTIYVAIDEKENIDNWDNWHYECFVRVDAAENAAVLFDNLKRTFHAPEGLGGDFAWTDDGLEFRFTKLRDLHFIAGVSHDTTPKSDKRTLFILITIAVVIVTMAGINYTNFSTALIPKRIRSINIQKVLGGRVCVIRAALLVEAVAICLCAFATALVVVHVAGDTPIASLIDAELSLSHHAGWVATTGLLAVLTGIAAGLYPSWRLTSFPPALALKGNFGLSPGGRKLRSTLTGIQYVASFALIISASFIYLQNVYMQRAPLGYDRDELLVTNLTPELSKQRDALADRLKRFAGIEDVTFSLSLLSSGDSYGTWQRMYRGQTIHFEILPVDYSFLRVMGIEVTDGRDFREEDRAAEGGVLIFNEKARRTFDMTLDDPVGGVKVAGFMADVKFASFRKEVSPMAFYVSSDRWWTSPRFACVRVKAGADLRAAMTHVRQTLKEFDGEYPLFDVRFFDEVLNRTYKQEQRLGSLITLFSFTAIFISIMGVFGLVIFDSEYRRREIGIRKVFGSTTGEILLTFNKAYVRILCICFALSAPVAWYAVSRWMENFAYRTPMYWWVYPAAFAVVFALTVATVTFQNRRAANANPIDSIKME
jgi:putative ABC transport system permease protein